MAELRGINEIAAVGYRQTARLQQTDEVVRTGVRFLEWKSVAHCIKIKRPAHLSIVERLGGF